MWDITAATQVYNRELKKKKKIHKTKPSFTYSRTLINAILGSSQHSSIIQHLNTKFNDPQGQKGRSCRLLNTLPSRALGVYLNCTPTWTSETTEHNAAPYRREWEAWGLVLYQPCTAQVDPYPVSVDSAQPKWALTLVFAETSQRVPQRSREAT